MPRYFLKEPEAGADLTMIKAITFDLWDTVIHDASDEVKRHALGLRSKRDERRHQVWTALQRLSPIDYEQVVLAYDVTEAAFNRVWKSHYCTWTVRERLRVLLNGLDRTLPEDEFVSLVEAHEQMEAKVPPDLVEGMNDVIASLSALYPLAVVSDAIVSPGKHLRTILDHHGVLEHFKAFAFSDELGHSKPHRAMFASVAQQLGVNIEQLLHIGDRDHNDVKGSQALGMATILFTATRNADEYNTSADAICASAADLPAAIEALVRNRSALSNMP